MHTRILVGILVLSVLGVTVFYSQVQRPTSYSGTYELYQHQDNRRSYGNAESSQYRIAIIADMDKKSHFGTTWRSHLREGMLTRDTSTGRYSIRWEHEPITYSSTLNENGRSMELSALADFDGKLLAFDDRTGVAFELYGEEAIPTHIFTDGDGRRSKGLKIEWATVKDDRLYVGSTGKEWTNPEGVIENYHPLWVKQVSPASTVVSLDWTSVYNRIRQLLKAEWPGYVLHEAIIWNNFLNRWFFLPRRVSSEQYDDQLDEMRASNIVVSANEALEDLRSFKLGPLDVRKGFSAAQFIPYREDEVIVLKTEEVSGSLATYIAVYNLDGSVLMPETFIDNIKYEGLEFLFAP